MEWRGHKYDAEEWTRHSYNARNQLIKTQEGDAVKEYRYDGRGNLTNITENGQLKSRFDFDATNMMVSAFTAGKGNAEYTYNGFRNRVKKLESLQNACAASGAPQDPTREVRYTLDLTLPYNNLLMTEGTQNQRFVWGNSLLSASGDDNFYYLQDHLGSPIRLLGEDQNDTPLAYDEFGVPLVESGQNPNNPFGFTGYQADEVSGLYYAQARYYEPQLGRFGAQDTHWNSEYGIYENALYEMSRGIVTPEVTDFLQISNLYVYCVNNPLFFIDRNGCYDREAAREYADKWSKAKWGLGNRNRNYYDYRTDCANFVSQCLLEGEIDMNNSWHSYKTFNANKFWLDPRSMVGWNYWYDWDVAPAWRLAADQYNYFKNPDNGFINGNVIMIDNIEDIAEYANSGLVQMGDLMYFADCDATDPHHATMISKVENGKIYFTGHTKSRFDKDLSESMEGQKVYIIPIRDDA